MHDRDILTMEPYLRPWILQHHRCIGRSAISKLLCQWRVVVGYIIPLGTSTSDVLLRCLNPVHSRPGFLLLPAGVQLSADRASESFGILHTWPAHRSRRSRMMCSSVGMPVNSPTFTFVTLSFQEIPRICRSHRWCAASNLFMEDGPSLCAVEKYWKNEWLV